MTTAIEKLLRGDGDVSEQARTASERMLSVARAEGLVDISYAIEPSPLGNLLVAVTPRGLVRIAYGADEGIDDALEELARRISPRVLEAPAALDEVRSELDQYFAGKRHGFDMPIDWRLVHGFTGRVLRATARIPYGHVLTYGDVAKKAGSPRGYRAAGNALGSNPIPIIVPCHRVVAAGGKLGGYTGGVDKKKYLLGLESHSNSE